MTDTALSPERTSTGIVVAVTLVAVGSYMSQLSITLTPVLVGIGGTLLLTVSLWLVESSPTPVRRFVVSLLSIPVAAGFAVGIFGTALLLTGALFPVETEADISVTLLLIAGNLGVVVGSGLAIFGITLGVTNVIAVDAIREYTKTAFLTAAVTLSAGFLLTIPSIMERGSVESGSVIESLLGQIVSTALAPSEPQLHLASFLIVLFFAAGGLWLLVWRLPLSDLLVGADRQIYQRVMIVASLPRLVAAGAAALTPPALLVEVLLSPPAVQAQIGELLFGVIQTITLASWLRTLLVGVAVVSFSIVIVTVGVAQWGRISRRETEAWLAPLAGGFVVTAVAMVFADSAFEWVVDESARQLPPELAAEFLNGATTAQQLYGTTSLVVLFIGGFIIVAALIGLFLLGAVQFGYLANEGAGFSIAAAGLFIGAITVSMIGASNWLLLGGVAVSLAVWDIGQFGTRLGREMRAGAGRELAIIRTGVMALVGVAGIGAAVFLNRILSAGTVELAPTTTAALVSLVVGLLAFAIALR